MRRGMYSMYLEQEMKVKKMEAKTDTNNTEIA